MEESSNKTPIMEHIVIIGNGISGITTARHIRKLSDKKITIISSESDHFWSRTALMYIYMGHMNYKDTKPYEDWFWEKNRLELKKGYVENIDTEKKMLHFAQGESLTYDKLIIATGSSTKYYDWEGQDLKGVQGMVSIQDLEQLEKNAPNKEVCPTAVIVGGGLIGVELAEMLRTREIDVKMLIRENAFWTNALPQGEAEMLSRHIKSHGVDIKHETNLKKILGDDQGNVRAVLTEEGEEIPCQVVGITTGVAPNISFLKESNIETDKGILVNRKLETSVKDVYAIGDCAQQRESIGNRPPVEAVWYTGRMMGETLAQTLCGNPVEYNPGNWFNSAKFFDVEYQTYGWVQPKARRKDFEVQYHWLCPSDLRCITVSYHKDTQEFLGLNTFGMRMKHQVIDKWLKEKRSVDYVISNLHHADFDPEFYKTPIKSIQKDYSNTNKTETANLQK